MQKKKQAKPQEYYDRALDVLFKDNVTLQEAINTLKKLGLQKINNTSFRLTRCLFVETRKGQENKILQQLQNEPNIETAERIPLRYLIEPVKSE